MKHIGFLYKYFGQPVDKEQIRMYWNLLKFLPESKFTDAVSSIVREFVPTSTVPFPLVKDFLKHCGETTVDKARIAISALKQAISSVGPYESIAFQDKALHFAINAFGGWTSICYWTNRDWDINEGRLIETYKSATYSSVDAPDHLPGIAEKEAGVFRLYLMHHSSSKKTAIRCNGTVPQLAFEKLLLSAGNG